MTKGDAVDFGDLSQGAMQNPGASKVMEVYNV